MGYRRWGLRRYRRSHGNYYRPAGPRFIIVFLLIIAIVLFLVFAERRLEPIVKQLSTSNTQLMVTQAISEAVAEEMKKSNITYNSLITLEKDSEGRISALRSNIVKINEFKSIISIVILEKINEIKYCEIKVPIGNLINGEILSGRGPTLRLKMIPAGHVSVNITNAFTTAGINQTRHQIMLEADVEVNIILPTGAATTNVSTNFCIAETVIVGGVPENFTSIERVDDSTLNDIYRFR